MLRVFFGIVFLCLILFGTLMLSYWIMLKSLTPKRKYEYYIIIPSGSCTSELTKAVYEAKLKIDLLGDSGYAEVIVLDTGMTDAQRLTCLNICRKTNGIYLVGKEQLKEIFR
ncbi:MAG: hypothetical protein E7514_05720 [Ruminococcaceae bacterium]|nr:hypothetical protein [Oscillospiraceae bacterium]